MNLKKSIILFLFIFCLFFFQGKAFAYSESSRPLFVEISTQWCYACKMLKPTIEQLQSEYAGRVDFVLLDLGLEEEAYKIAGQYGITDFLNSNKNAFPTVGILCSGSSRAEKILVGAANKEIYTSALDAFLQDTTKICAINGRPAEGIPGPDRPNEATITSIPGGRPQEFVSLGRPPELTFWTAGQPIPAYAYYQLLVLPKCSSNNNILCSNAVGTSTYSNNTQTKPPFEPWNPNATRDVKGYKL